MLIDKVDEINDIYYGTQGYSVQLDNDLTELYRISGSVLPRSTYQVINDVSPSLGLVTGVSRGSSGNVWVSDLNNDRVLELDKSGKLITAFYGSFIDAPNDPYGIEDFGPGSNEVTATMTTTTTTLAIGSTLDILHSIYNSDSGELYVVFDADLENVYDAATTLNLNKLYLKIGTQKFYLNDSTIELLGVGEDAYDNWVALTTSTDDGAEFINQFKFTSHVLKITLQGADKTLLNYMVDQEAPSIVIASPYEQELVSKSVTVQFLLYNFDLGTVGDANRIRVTLDGGTSQDIYNNYVSFTGLENGVHTVVAQLVDADGTLNTNIEAIAEGTFIVNVGTYSEPYIAVTSPKPNQIYSSSPVVIDFEVENFAVLPTGQHVRYVVDTDAPIDYYSTDSITLNDLDAGAHTIRLYLVDKNGVELAYTYGSVTADFIVGLNSEARLKLYADSGAIYDISDSITNVNVRKDVDVANIYFSNIYSPIDIQVIPCETSKVNLDGLPTVLVAKLRSPSWTNGLSGTTYATEYIRRIAETANVAAGVTTSVVSNSFDSIPTAELIYGTKYLDGHSVVQISMDGDVIFSNNAAVFAPSKTLAESLLGSAQKLGDSELLIGDSYNKRAIITYADLDTEASKITWQFDSDRNVPDFHIILQDNVTISINDDAISESEVFIRQGTLVIWENNSASPVSIYSGTTTYDEFQLDQDLNLYGDVFESEVLQPGERYSYKFVECSEVNWFVYPEILTGSITVTKNRISSRDQFIVLESDNLESPFTSRVIKVDSYGNVLWSFGEGGYLVKPRDARVLLNDGVLIST